MEPDFFRIQAIATLVDSHNSKAALKAIEGDLKKLPQSFVLRSFQALVLARLGREADSFELGKALKDSYTGSDITVLSTLAYTFRALRKQTCCLEIWEAASSRNPGFPDIAEELFFTYLEDGVFEKAQQAAQKLCQIHSKLPSSDRRKTEKFSRWAVCCNYLASLSINDPSSSKKTLLVSLTQRSAAKICSELKPDDVPVNEDGNPVQNSDAEFFRFYISVLFQHEKFADILEVLNTPGRRFLDLNREDLRLVCISLLKVGDTNGCRRVLGYLLSIPSFQDDFDLWTMLQEACSKGSVSNMGEKSRVPDSLHAEIAGVPEDFPEHGIEQFIRSCIRNKTSAIRGPYLALLQFLLSKGRDDEFIRAYLDFFETFGSKNAFFYDSRLILENLEASKTVHLVQCLRESVGGHYLVEENDSLEVCQRKMSIAKMQRLAPGFCNLIEEGRKCLQNYFRMLKFGKSLEKTENQYGDDFLILAVHYMMDDCALSTADEKLQCLSFSVKLLENGIRRSAKNFWFKTLLLRLYALLGCFTQAYSMWESLEIKNVQSESLSFLLLGDSFLLPAPEQLLNDITEFHEEHDSMMSRVVGSHFRLGSFSKIQGTVEFRDKCVRSASRWYAAVADGLCVISSCSPSSTDFAARLSKCGEVIDIDRMASNAWTCSAPSGMPFPFSGLCSCWDTAVVSFFEPVNRSLSKLQLSLNPPPFAELISGNKSLVCSRTVLLPHFLTSSEAFCQWYEDLNDGLSSMKLWNDIFQRLSNAKKDPDLSSAMATLSLEMSARSLSLTAFVESIRAVALSIFAFEESEAVAASEKFQQVLAHTFETLLNDAMLFDGSNFHVLNQLSLRLRVVLSIFNSFSSILKTLCQSKQHAGRFFPETLAFMKKIQQDSGIRVADVAKKLTTFLNNAFTIPAISWGKWDVPENPDSVLEAEVRSMITTQRKTVISNILSLFNFVQKPAS
eukprot:ANDGO_03598.mRNA.1 Phagocyte signaling-impaired protein